ncbi:MAG: hypothetical protein JRI36_04535 [Deltaproteobacteria bacterium]|nr:hypothetical protein [Deltaproteobacteria bacterium]
MAADDGMEDLRKACGEILRSLPLGYRWRWDDEHHVALVTVERDRLDPVLGALSEHFDREWDFSTIDEAPEAVAGFFRSSLGLFPGQKAFTLENHNGITLFAVWWPWADEQKISLRIGMFATSGQRSDPSELQDCLMRWFAI